MRTLHELDKLKKQFDEELGTLTKEKVFQQGNVFFINSVGEATSKVCGP